MPQFAAYIGKEINLTGLCLVISEEPLRLLIYDIDARSVIHCKNIAEKLMDECLLFNFKKSDERILTENGYLTLSMPTLLSIVGGCSFTFEDIDCIFQKALGIRYTHIFGRSCKVDFAILYQSSYFWDKMANFAKECLELIEEYGLNTSLLLEARTTAVLHEMFKEPYPFDRKKAMAEYKKLDKILFKTKQKIRTDFSVSPYICESMVEDEQLLKLTRLLCKTEDKMKRFPIDILDNHSEKILIPCDFRSIGTDTFRIVTEKRNIQGFPKVLRKCLLPRYGDLLLEYDVESSQIVILAYLSDEKSLIQEYERGQDLYFYIFSRILPEHCDQIDVEKRTAIKHLLLQMLYGAGSRTLQKELSDSDCGIGYEKIQGMQENFYQIFPRIREYITRLKKEEMIQLPTGYKWHMANCVEPYKRLAYVLQYLESQILRMVLVLLEDESQGQNFKLYLCIHDSIMIETVKENHPVVDRTVQKCFDKAMQKYFRGLSGLRIKEEIIYD